MKKILSTIITVYFLLIFSFLFNSHQVLAVTCEVIHVNFTGQCVTSDQDCPADKQAIDTSRQDLCLPGQKCCYKTVADSGTELQPISEDNIKLQIPLFNFSEADNLAQYILKIYEYILIVLVPLTIIMIIWGGIQWIIAAGESNKINLAKKQIIQAFIGLFIGLFSYMFLSLVGIETVTVPEIQKLPTYDDYEALVMYDDLPPSIAQTDPNVPFKPLQATKNIVTANCETTSGTKKVQVDQSISQVIEKTCQQIKASGFQIKEIGGFRPSTHCHGKGLAVDINVPQNYCLNCYNKGGKVGNHYNPSPVGNDPLSVTANMVNIMKNNGWCWGGDWKSFKDFMHFSIGCSRAECAHPCSYDFNISLQANLKKCGIRGNW